MTGRVHSFQSLGTVDGPGVRCVVFMQGCPLRCICCHNPDTWNMNGGEEFDVERLVKKVLRFRSYFGEKGGVTVSGGEPLMQTEFVTEFFKALRINGVNTALDTSGCVFTEKTEELLKYTDLVLLDHKYPTEEEYRRYTGGSLEKTERFLNELEKRNIPVWLRRVIIPGKTDDEDGVKKLNEVAGRFSCVKKIELLPFRNICASKYTELGIPFPLDGVQPPSNEIIERLNSLINDDYK